MEDEWFTFEGDDSGCDDNCRGWDGFNRRCDCGNRRVGLECNWENKCNKSSPNDNDCMECEHSFAVAW